ncbi:type II toxin-antitoxin system VapC family toxin [Novosphingobium resinovorum]|uniref:type II toxin-antitoxin system VapC family toxin n=1 Tax=Novosphingobium TaxID=165696 RepID=UPI001B3C73FC|nr:MULTISPECIES: type II toxin-antitoxin system VapC family toxin [Novosphingobium]MBF7013689.1 type II toxin-antitoxin system VapC family toxin [Novosphingobium sp. HR1a]WJM25834.1 type II toxin-antitoxin system VapC family toxin [Novosphingobium resinovorum]
MKITADTNILVRAVTEDDPVQAPIAQRLLAEATLVAMPIASLCEFVWVLGRAYGFLKADIARTIRALVNGDNVEADLGAVEAGLAMLEAGGDFGDGAIAHEGKWLGGETFVSFDRKAIALLEGQGETVLLPS